MSKANAFNNEQEKYLGQRISTARLARVQEAMKQLKENNRVGAEKASGGAAVAQGKTREVLLVGHDYAFVFENGSGKSTVEIGRLEILRSVGGDHLADGAMLLDDAKRARVMVVCQWFTETVTSGATVFVLGGVVHPVQYSAWSILGEAHLDLVDSSTQTYRFVDEGARSMFELTCEVTEPREALFQTPQRTQAHESKAETTARRKGEEESRKAEAVFAASTAVEVVVRAPGKRRATKAAVTRN